MCSLHQSVRLLAVGYIFDIKNFAETVKKDNIDVAIIAVPAEFAQRVLEQIAKAGIKAVMNFAPTPLRVEGSIKLKTVDLTISLESLSYFLAQPNNLNGKVLKPKMDNRRNNKS